MHKQTFSDPNPLERKPQRFQLIFQAHNPRCACMAMICQFNSDQGAA